MFLVYIIVIIIVVIVVYYLYKRYKSGLLSSTRLSSFLSLTPSSNSSNLLQCTGSEEPLILPLIYNRNFGLYQTVLNVGNMTQQRSFTVVPDTGSSVLLLNGSSCTNCDLADGLFDPSMGTQISSFTRKITYGAQQTTHYLQYKSYLMNYRDGNGNIVPKEIEFGLITQSQSADNDPLQVLGLQPDGPGFIQGLCSSDVLFDFPAAKLIIGVKRSDLENNLSNYTSGSDQLLLHGADLYKPHSGPAYPIAKLSSFSINNKILPNIKYIIFDTGSTDTVIPGFNAAGYQTNNSNLNIGITFANGQSTNSIGLTAKLSSIRSDNLPINNAILVGIGWLKNRKLYIDSDNNKIYFA